MLEKTLKRSLDGKEIKPVNPEGNHPGTFTGRTDAEVPILRPPDEKSQLIGKDHDAGKDWRQKEKGATEDEIVGWHHRLHGHEFEQTLGESEGQGSLACCSPSQGRDNQPAPPASEASLRLTERPAWACPHEDILTWHIKQPLLKFVWFFLHQTHAGQPSPFKTASHCSPRENKMRLGMVLRYHSKDKPHITKRHHRSYCLPYKSAGWTFLL